jgi:6,7-dimethyl-8-ribityllumazine synthase
MTPDRIQLIEGGLGAEGLRFGIIASRFNEFITSRLLAGALDVLAKAGAPDDAVRLVRVPGAFEIPLVARRLARSRRFDAIICLGAVIRGETPHFEYIAAEASRGIMQAACDFDLPVVFGVLTTDTVEQALQRSGAPEQNRGADAARTAIEMANLMKTLTGVRPLAERRASGPPADKLTQRGRANKLTRKTSGTGRRRMR